MTEPRPGARTRAGGSARPRLDSADLAAARRRWERGDATISIAVFLHRSENRVRELARIHGWTRPPGFEAEMRALCRWAPTREQEDRLRDMWEGRALASEMEDMFGVTFKTITRVAHELGLPHRDLVAINEERRVAGIGRFGRGRQRLLQVCRLWDAGLTTAVIAERTGLTVSAVRDKISDGRKLGVVRRPSPIIRLAVPSAALGAAFS